MDLVAVAALLFAFAFTFTNGFQDAAAIAATFIASRSATPRQGIVLVAGMNVIGAVLGGSAVAFTLSEPHRGDRAVPDPCGAPRRARHRERLEPRHLVAGPALVLDPRPRRRPHRGRRGRYRYRLGQLGRGCPHGSHARARGRDEGARSSRGLGRHRPGRGLRGPAGPGRAVEKLPTTRGAAADRRCELGRGPRHGLLQRGERCAESSSGSSRSCSSPQARRRRSRSRSGRERLRPCSSGSEPSAEGGGS